MGEWQAFKVGQRVEKFTGDVTGFGEVRAVYTTTRGKLRYVVEVEPQGFQMIWTESQLRHAPAPPDLTGGRTDD